PAAALAHAVAPGRLRRRRPGLGPRLARHPRVRQLLLAAAPLHLLDHDPGGAHGRGYHLRPRAETLVRTRVPPAGHPLRGARRALPRRRRLRRPRAGRDPRRRLALELRPGRDRLVDTPRYDRLGAVPDLPRLRRLPPRAARLPPDGLAERA